MMLQLIMSRGSFSSTDVLKNRLFPIRLFIFVPNQKLMLSFISRKSLRKAHLVGLAFSFSQAIMYLIYSVGFYFGAWLMENDGLLFADLFK